jgi:hypothetical protein
VLRRRAAVRRSLRWKAPSRLEVHAARAREAPDQARRFAILTGGAFSPRAEALLDAFPCRVVEKPFSREALLACVRALQAG